MKETYNPFDIINSRLMNITNELVTIKEIIESPKPSIPDDFRLLTIEQVCEYLNISRVTVWKWENKRILRPILIGKLKRYSLKDIEAITVKK